MNKSLEIGVRSEIGALERVLVHEPGDEVVHMTQHNLEELLFDDLLSPLETQREHDLMSDIMRDAGAEVLEVRTLLTEALTQAPRAATEQLLTQVCNLEGLQDLAPVLATQAPAALTRALIAGLHWSELSDAPMSLDRIRRQLDSPTNMALQPIPNLLFMRDPCMVVGERVIVGHMASTARAREPLLVAFALEHGGGIKTSDFLFREPEMERHPNFRSLEGGDLLVTSDSWLLIGCSQRTKAATIERLAHDTLFESFNALQRVHVIMLPEQRSCMHLDTVLTQIDAQTFLGHAPLIRHTIHDQPLPVCSLYRDQQAIQQGQLTVLDLLRAELGPDTEIVPCGGDDPLHQAREQWTDGANALCLKPGCIILYARNRYTIKALERLGYQEVQLNVAQTRDERKARVESGLKQQRTIFSFTGSELSRGRGGGRCLTMPLSRN